MAREKLYRIRIKNDPRVRNHSDLHKFAGLVRIAKLTAAGIFLFTFAYSNGVRIIEEPYTIASYLVDILDISP